LPTASAITTPSAKSQPVHTEGDVLVESVYPPLMCAAFDSSRQSLNSMLMLASTFGQAVKCQP